MDAKDKAVQHLRTIIRQADDWRNGSQPVASTATDIMVEADRVISVVKTEAEQALVAVGQLS